MDHQDDYRSLLRMLDTISYVKPDKIPDIELYMDQVTSFMEEHLRKVKRRPEDKVLTKTMINNYTKARILPPPAKKKYSKEHMFMLLFIYYYKGILSLDDLNIVLHKLNERYFGKDARPNVEDIYSEVFAMEASQMQVLKKDLSQKFQLAETTFSKEHAAFKDLTDAERDDLRLFSFICELAFDVYLKKLMMEKLCDRLRESEEKEAH